VKGLFATQSLGPHDRDCALLTFDDGPSPEGTPLILDTLRRYGARALFFVIGSRIERAPHLLRRMIDEGHIIGNHSHRHATGRSLGLRRYVDDVRRCQEAIEQVTTIRPTMFRPPLGELSPWTISASYLLGLQCVLWSIDSGDWRIRNHDDLSACERRLSARLSQRHLHDIILLHDEQPWSAMLLETVLPPLVERGVDLGNGVDVLTGGRPIGANKRSQSGLIA